VRTASFIYSQPESASTKSQSSYTESLSELVQFLPGINNLFLRIVTARDLARLIKLF